MRKTLFATRRHALAAIGALTVALPITAQAQSILDATSLGVSADTGKDQSAALQKALDRAASSGQSLRLPAGKIVASNLAFPNNILIEGVPGATQLVGASIGQIANSANVVLRDLAFLGLADNNADGPALLDITDSSAVTLERCQFSKGATGLLLTNAAVIVRDCSFTDLADAAIHSLDSAGLVISGNRITGCGNAGVRIWRSASGPDGSIITQNRIAKIAWVGGGNGQNGNGINIFRADEVIIADNHLADCAFSAIRLNTTNNTQVSGNTCLRSGETAIFSEFAFSGSVIANNIVDGAAAGISMTNLDNGGRLAVCSGNIVRNIAPLSMVNPDSQPYGIAAEGDAAITGNTLENIPGVAISAGFGPFLRNVLISGNVVYGSAIGIGVSVAPGAGSVHIGDNLIHEPRQYAVVGLEWDRIVEPDLLANAPRYPNVTVTAR